MSTDTTTELPLDWNVWRGAWARWLFDHDAQMTHTPSPFKGKNFLADEILGVWKVRGRVVELSEVTFPDFRRDPATGQLPHNDRRGIGVTFGDDKEPGATVVDSFEELESVLGL